MWIKNFLHEDHIHCIGTTACGGAFDRIVFGMKKITPDEGVDYPHDFPSTAVRTLAKERIASYTGREKNEIEILRKKTARGLWPPMVWVKGKKTDMDISLSHDGRYEAFAFIAA